MIGCVVRLILWCVNEREYFLCHFSLKSVEINNLNVGEFLFGMVIWEVYIVLLDRGFSGKSLGTDMLMDVVVEVVVVEAMDVVQVVQVWFIVFFRRVCLGDVMGVRVVVEVVVGAVVLVSAVVLVWWRCSVV